MTSARARALVAAGAGLWLGALTMRMDDASAASIQRSTPAPSAVADTLPGRLSETGLYADPTTLSVDPRNRTFTPQYPLWSDGAGKSRWIRLPDGASIDAGDADRWDFPVGTRFWKEFAFSGIKVETRYLVKVAHDRWTFASYQWSADQRDATRAPVDGVPAVAEVAPGKWHSIPSEAECRACHDSGRTEVLGFTALQLSDDRDPLAPHAEPLAPGAVTLRTLIGEGRLSGVDGAHATTPPRIAAASPTERAVLGYLSTNCGSCHNRQSTMASLGLFLKHSLTTADTCVPDAIATTVGRPGHWVVPSAPEGESRLVSPGRVEVSALFRRAQSRRPSSQMPPFGTVVADAEGLALVRQWIQSMDAGRATCLDQSAATR